MKMAYIERKKKATRRRSDVRAGARQEVYQSALWKKLRTQKLMETPLCEVCLLQDKVKGGDHVHHIVSFADAIDLTERDRLAYDPANLMTVCEECHGRIHGGDLRGCRSLEEIKRRIGS